MPSKADADIKSMEFVSRKHRSKLVRVKLVFAIVVVTILTSCSSADSTSPSEEPSSTASDAFGDYEYVEGLCDHLDWGLVEQLGDIDPEQSNDLESGHPGGYKYNLCERTTSDVTFKFQARYASAEDQLEDLVSSGWSFNPTCAEDELETNESWEMANFTVHNDFEQWHQFSCAQFLDSNLAVAMVVGYSDKGTQPPWSAEWEELTADITIALADQARQLAKR